MMDGLPSVNLNDAQQLIISKYKLTAGRIHSRETLFFRFLQTINQTNKQPPRFPLQLPPAGNNYNKQPPEEASRNRENGWLAGWWRE
jgi:hypothetical protein